MDAEDESMVQELVTKLVQSVGVHLGTVRLTSVRAIAKVDAVVAVMPEAADPPPPVGTEHALNVQGLVVAPIPSKM